MANQLPVEVGHLFVYRENAVVTIEEKDGFALQCNMLFKVCTLHLSGTLINFPLIFSFHLRKLLATFYIYFYLVIFSLFKMLLQYFSLLN